jgi:DNA-directed RNA polymerase subunit RPC12/RpoP
MKLLSILNESTKDSIKCEHCGWKWKKSEGGKEPYVCHKCGHNCKPNSFDSFAEKRLKGASKIADSAKEKGGPSMLTYHHFVVKLPYYEQASEGKFNFAAAVKEFDYCVNTLAKKMDNMEQVEFQKLMGKIEVLGELIIKNK